MKQEMIFDNNFCRNEFLKSNNNVIYEFYKLKKIEQICAEFNFEILQEQFELSYSEEDFKPITGNFLILSDRLRAMACKLGSFINEKTSGCVVGITTGRDELEKDMLNVDYLIIVGYLENESHFEMIEEIRKTNPRMNVIFYTTQSSITKRQMNEYRIDCIFERHQPLAEFLKLFY